MPVIEYLIEAGMLPGLVPCETVARLVLDPEVVRLVLDVQTARLDLTPDVARLSFDPTVARLDATPDVARLVRDEILARVQCPGGIVPNLPQKVVQGADTVLPFQCVTQVSGVDTAHDLTGDTAIEFYLKDGPDQDDPAPTYTKSAGSITYTNSGTDGRLLVQTRAADVDKARKWYHLDTVKAGKRTVWAYGVISREGV